MPSKPSGTAETACCLHLSSSLTPKFVTTDMGRSDDIRNDDTEDTAALLCSDKPRLTHNSPGLL